MKTKTEIINETAAYYSEDTSRRALSINKDGSIAGCKYLTDDGRMCAVGRCFTENGLEKFGNHGGYYNMNMLPLFKEDYQIYDDYFWSDLQRLHDNAYNWNKEGLTEVGKEFVQYLLNVYKD
jgi:hypothetical protein